MVRARARAHRYRYRCTSVCTHVSMHPRQYAPTDVIKCVYESNFAITLCLQDNAHILALWRGSVLKFPGKKESWHRVYRATWLTAHMDALFNTDNVR